MRPVRTAASNFVYTGPRPEIGDLHCQRLAPGRIRAVYWLTAEDRAAIAAGANVAIELLTEPIPPIWLGVTDEQGAGEDAPDVLARLSEYRP